MTASIIAIVSGYLALIGYSVWLFINYRNTKNAYAVVKIKCDQAENGLMAIRQELENVVAMYEKRLAAKQEALDAIKKRLLDKASASDIGLLIDSELSEEG